MSLTSIQLCAIDPVDRAAGKFQVTVHSDDGKQLAIFDCSSEMDARRLRTAIREHADQLRRVADYRERQANRKPAQVPEPDISYTSEVRPRGAQEWSGHGLRFGTEAEARRFAILLTLGWLRAPEVRMTSTELPATHTLTDIGLLVERGVA